MSEGRRDREQFVPENETLRHRVEALQAEAERFKAALYSIGDAVISAAGDGNALTRMVLCAIEDINEHTQAVETCKRGDYLHSVGSDRMVPSSSATIFHPDDNASVATVAQGRDITEQSRVEEALHASREQLRALSARLLVVREEERTSIARDIHDLLAQDLTRLKIDLVWL